VEPFDALTEGIESDWWRGIIGELFPLDQVLALYAPGFGRWHRGIHLLELHGEPLLLAVTSGSLVGMRLSQEGERSYLHVEKWIVSLDRVTRVESEWDSWFDRENASISGVGHVGVKILLDVPLGELGVEINLPINLRDDYGGRRDVSESQTRGFCNALEKLLARGRQD
jgi:hypothetical protein